MVLIIDGTILYFHVLYTLHISLKDVKNPDSVPSENEEVVLIVAYADICRRNRTNNLIGFGDKDNTLNDPPKGD